MTEDRLSVVLRAMAAVRTGGPISVIDRVCGAAVSLLSLRGAGLSLMVDGELRGTAGVSEPGIAAIQELQFTLGEGPCVDAWAGGKPVTAPDLAAAAEIRWPAFAQASVAADTQAVFAFPLQLGAIRLGVLALYRDRVGTLSAEELALGLVLADVAAQAVLGLQAGATGDSLHELLSEEPVHWAEIHQATGMLSVQLEVPLEEAFVRLRAHAFADNRPLRLVSRDVVAGRLQLEDAA